MKKHWKKLWSTIPIISLALIISSTAIAVPLVIIFSDKECISVDISFNENFNGKNLNNKEQNASEAANEQFIKDNVIKYKNEIFKNANSKNQLFYKNNMVISDIIHEDSIGKVSFTCTLNDINDKGDDISKKKLYFNGFKVPYTINFNQKNDFDFGDSTKYADDSTINRRWIKDKVIEHKDEIFIIPQTILIDYSWEDNLTISNLVSNNATGQVNFDISLQNATNTSTNNTINKKITFSGFYVPYSITFKNISQFPFGDQNLLASNINIDDTWIEEVIVNNKEEIFNISDDIPNNFNWYNNLIISSIIRDSLNSKIIFDVALNNAFYGPNNTINNTLTFTNFKRPYLISFKDQNEFAFGDNNVFVIDASFDGEWIKNKIITNKNLIFNTSNNIPNDFDWNSNLTISNINKDYENGKITFDLELINASDEPSYRTITKTLTFTSFNYPYSITFKNTEFDFGNSNVFADDTSINETWIKNTIINNKYEVFNISTNTPNNFDWNSNLSINNITSNIKTGQISFDLTLNNATDNINNNSSITKTIIISGFKITWFIEFNNQVEYPYGDPNKLAAGGSADATWVKNKVLEHKEDIFNIPDAVPSSYDWNSNLSINIISGNNLEGTITFRVTLTNSSDKLPIDPISKKIKFTGFIEADFNITLQYLDQGWGGVIYHYGDPNISINDVDREWIKRKIIEKKDQIFNFRGIVPDDFDWYNNLTIPGITRTDYGSNHYSLEFSLSLDYANSITNNSISTIGRDIWFFDFTH